MDTEEVNQGMSKEIRQDTLIPLTADLAPEIGTLLAKVRREVDEERDLYGSGHECMAHQLGVVFVEERIAVVGEGDDEGVLLAVALYDLVDDVVGIEKAIGGGRDDGILHRILTVGEAVVGEAYEGLGVALAIGHVRAHEMHHLEEPEG